MRPEGDGVEHEAVGRWDLLTGTPPYQRSHRLEEAAQPEVLWQAAPVLELGRLEVQNLLEGVIQQVYEQPG